MADCSDHPRRGCLRRGPVESQLVKFNGSPHVTLIKFNERNAIRSDRHASRYAGAGNSFPVAAAVGQVLTEKGSGPVNAITTRMKTLKAKID